MSIKQGDKCQNVLSPNKFFNRYDVTYIVVVQRLGLASQEVDVFTKTTNESIWNLYGYKDVSQPQFFIQTQV